MHTIRKSACRVCETAANRITEAVKIPFSYLGKWAESYPSEYQRMLSNFVKSARNVFSGKHIASVKSYYDPRFPPTKFFKPNTARIRVRCILSGFPRTGTHWIRNVVHTSTGLGTYAVGAKGQLPSLENGILVKVHARNKSVARAKALWLLPRHNFDGKYIYTYRDPRDAILSLYEMYKHSKGRPNLSQEEFLTMYDPIGQYKWEMKAWVLRNHDDVLRIRFEDLRKDPLLGFQEIFKYIGLEASVDAESIDKPVANSDGVNRPRRSVFGWKTAPKEYQPLIKLVSEQLDHEIRALNYEIG